MYRQDKGHCEWVSHQETPNLDLIEIGRFVQQVDEIWEDHSREIRQNLEERDRRLKAKKMATAQEKEEQERKETNKMTVEQSGDRAEATGDAREEVDRERCRRNVKTH